MPPVSGENVVYLCVEYLSHRGRADGYDDVLFLSTADAVCESSGSNVFFVKGNALFTPTAELASTGLPEG